MCRELRACEARVTALATPETVSQATYWYEQGQRDSLDAAVQRVEALATERELKSPSDISVDLRDAIAAIKGDSDA
jgi:hypothetical protein